MFISGSLCLVHCTVQRVLRHIWADLFSSLLVGDSDLGIRSQNMKTIYHELSACLGSLHSIHFISLLYRIYSPLLPFSRAVHSSLLLFSESKCKDYRILQPYFSSSETLLCAAYSVGTVLFIYETGSLGRFKRSPTRGHQILEYCCC